MLINVSNETGKVFITTLVLFSIVNASLICYGTRSGASAMNNCIYVYRMFSVCCANKIPLLEFKVSFFFAYQSL